MPGMDQIPIGEKPDTPSERHAGNVVRLPTKGPAPSGETAAESGAGAAAESTSAAEPDPQTQAGAEGGPPADEGMSWEEALAVDAAEGEDPDAEAAAPPPGSAIAGLLEQGVRVGAGLFSAGATAFADALRSSMPDDASPTQTDPAAKIAGAGMGAAVTAAEAAAGAAGSAADRAAPLLSWLVNPPFLKGAGEAAAGAGRVLDGQWQAAQAEAVQAATSFLSILVPEIVGAVMDQIDLNQLVQERVDVDAIVSRVDLNGVVDRIDVGAIVDKVDVNAIVERVDFEAVIDRLDITAIAQDVLDDIDLPGIIRDSSGAMASEGVQEVRLLGMGGDRLVAGVVDRVLRRSERDLHGPSPAG